MAIFVTNGVPYVRPKKPARANFFFGHTLDLENFHEIFFFRIMLCTYPGY